MPDTPIRCILADDHPVVLQGLQRLFESQSDLEVVRCCTTGADAIAAVREGGADVLVLDLKMPVTSGLAVLRAMAEEMPATPCRVVLLTATVTDAEAVEAISLGAMGLVLKESSPDAVMECVRRVHRGEQWIDRQTMGRAFGRVLRQGAATREASKILTAREMEIVLLVAQGHRNKAVGERLFISEGTVKIHLHNVYQKLGVDGRLELLLWVQEKGLATPVAK